MILSMENLTACKLYGEKKSAKMFKDAGFDAFDFSYYYLEQTEGRQEAVLGENYREFAKDLREYINSIGIICNQAHAPFDLTFEDELDESNITFLRLARSIESAAILGAEIIVIHSYDVPEGKDLIEENVKMYKAFAPYAKKSGIKIGVENLMNFGTPEALNELMNILNDDVFVSCIDLGHSALNNVEPEDFLRGVDASRIGCIHVSDNNYKYDDHLPPYFGSFNWDNITKALKDIDYNGDFTLEVFEFNDNLIKPDIYPIALEMNEKIGRKLIKMVEES